MKADSLGIVRENGLLAILTFFVVESWISIFPGEWFCWDHDDSITLLPCTLLPWHFPFLTSRLCCCCFHLDEVFVNILRLFVVIVCVVCYPQTCVCNEVLEYHAFHVFSVFEMLSIISPFLFTFEHIHKCNLCKYVGCSQSLLTSAHFTIKRGFGTLSCVAKPRVP